MPFFLSRALCTFSLLARTVLLPLPLPHHSLLTLPFLRTWAAFTAVLLTWPGALAPGSPRILSCTEFMLPLLLSPRKLPQVLPFFSLFFLQLPYLLYTHTLVAVHFIFWLPTCLPSPAWSLPSLACHANSGSGSPVHMFLCVSRTWAGSHHMYGCFRCTSSVSSVPCCIPAPAGSGWRLTGPGR